uniref:Uncharacterized protein n=1 Tax=Globodera rostochiensis TaxID=31243 RepID=A0A914HL75_GLORO
MAKYAKNCDYDSSGNNGGNHVVHRGNNCLCVTICEACVINGWWQHYIESSAATAALAVEANEDPFTGLPREGLESYRAWVEAHEQAKYAVKKVATFIAITAAHPRKKGVPKDAHNLTAAGPLSTLNGQTLLDEHGRRRRRKLCCCCYGEGIDGLSGGRENGCLDNDDDWTDGDGEVWTDGDDGGGGSATSF